ncbi:MAG: RHS repeat-associated core domain-containing protein [Planctomycetota bacterium]
MRRFALCTALALVPWLSGMFSAEGAAAPKRPLRPDPEVEIISPADNTATNAASIPVKVHFRGQIQILGKKTIPVGLIQEVVLKADGVVVGRYEPRRPIHEGNYTFTLNLAAYPDKSIALQAFASQGKKKREETAESDIVHLLVDRTKPVLTASLSPTPTASGWNNSPVTVTFIATDALSGIATVTAPVTISGEGTGQLVTGTATDKAGNSVTFTATVNIDKTAPVLSATLSPLPNGAGWNKSDVTVTFTATDALSGVLNIAPPVTISLDGAGRLVLGTATDKAGNTTTLSATVNLDKTPPALSAALAPAPNATGWNNSDGTVTFTASDSLSGISGVSAPQTISAEGANQVVSGSASDKAGNPADVAATVSLDKTAPVISSLLPASGSTPDSARPAFSASFADMLSGVDPAGVHIVLDGNDITSQTGITAAGFTFTPAQDLSDGSHAVAVTITDLAGNFASASTSFTILTQDTDGDGIPDNVDNDPLVPFVKITSPTNGILTNRPLIEISGTVDPLATRVEVKNLATPGVAPSAISLSGAATFRAAGIPLVEGVNTIEVEANSATGQYPGTSRITMNVDWTPPVITLTPTPNENPARVLDLTGYVGSFVSDHVEPIRASFSDTGLSGGINTDSFTAWLVKLDFTPYHQGYCQVGGHWFWGWILDNFISATQINAKFTVTDALAETKGDAIGLERFKTNVILYTVADKAGNTAFALTYYAVDETPPVVEDATGSFNEGQILNPGDVITYSYKVKDNLSGVALVNDLTHIVGAAFYMSRESSSVSPPLSVLGNEALVTGTFHLPADIPAGSYVLNISDGRMTDYQGNESDPQTFSRGFSIGQEDCRHVDILSNIYRYNLPIYYHFVLEDLGRPEDPSRYYGFDSYYHNIYTGTAGRLRLPLPPEAVGPFRIIEGSFEKQTMCPVMVGTAGGFSAPIVAMCGTVTCEFAVDIYFIGGQGIPDAVTLVLDPGQRSQDISYLQNQGYVINPLSLVDIARIESSIDGINIVGVHPGVGCLFGGLCDYNSDLGKAIVVQGPVVDVPNMNLPPRPGVTLGLSPGEVIQAVGSTPEALPIVRISGGVFDVIGKSYPDYAPTAVYLDGRQVAALVEPGDIGTGWKNFETDPISLKRGRNSLLFSVPNRIGIAGVARAEIDVVDTNGNFVVKVVSVINAAAQGALGRIRVFSGPGESVQTCQLKNTRGMTEGEWKTINLTETGHYEWSLVGTYAHETTGVFVLVPEDKWPLVKDDPNFPGVRARVGDQLAVNTELSAYQALGTVYGADIQREEDLGSSSVPTITDSLQADVVVALSDSQQRIVDDAFVRYGHGVCWAGDALTTISATLKSYDRKNVEVGSQAVILTRQGNTPVYRTSVPVNFSGSGAGLLIVENGRIDVPSVVVSYPWGDELYCWDQPNHVCCQDRSFNTPSTTRPVGSFWRATPQESSRGNTPTGGAGVFLHNGEFVLSGTDLVVGSARGPGFAFFRTYRSQINYNGPLGWGWDFTLNARIEERDENGDGFPDAVYYDGAGRRDVFILDTLTASYLSPAGVFLALEKGEDGLFMLIDGAGTRSRFADSLQSVTDRDGNALFLCYDALGCLETATDGQDRNYAFAYRAADPGKGKLSSISDFSGRTVTFEYTAAGDLWKVTDPDGTWVYGYDSAHNLKMVTDPRGNLVVDNTYDPNDRVYQQMVGNLSLGAFSAGGLWTIAYNNSASTTVTDPTGRMTTYTWDSEAHIVPGAITVDGKTTTQTYNGNFDPLVTTYPLGNILTCTYEDAANPIPTKRGNVISTTRAPDPRGGDTIVTSATYTGPGDFPGADAEEAKYWNFVKTTMDATLKDAAREETRHEYDERGRLVKVTLPTVKYNDDSTETLKTEYRYNDHGQMLAVLHPDTRITWYEYYESNGRPGDPADLEGYLKRTVTSVNRGHAITEAEAMPATARTTPLLYDTTDYACDTRGNALTTVDNPGRGWVKEYDVMDRVAKEYSPPVHGTMRNITIYTYDKNSNLLSASTEIPRPSDSVEWETRTSLVTRVYDVLNRVISVNENGRTTAWIYDGAGRTLSVKSGLDRSTTYAYDPAGRRTRTVTGDDDFDATNGGSGNATVVDLVLDDNGNITETRGNDVTVAQASYDGQDRPKVSTEPATGATSQVLAYDPRGVATERQSGTGNLSGVTAVGAKTATTLNELGGTKYVKDLLWTGSEGASAIPVFYKYDEKITTGESISYNPKDDTIKTITTESVSISGRSVVTTNPDGSVVTRWYNADGAVSREIVTGSGPDRTTDYIYDQVGHLAETRTTGMAAGETLTTTYVCDGAGKPVWITEPTGAKTYNVYAPGGELLSTTRGHGTPEAVTKIITYDTCGRVVTERQRAATETQGGQITMWNYDAKGRLASVQYGLLGTETFHYDGLDRLNEKILRDGVTKLVYVYAGESSRVLEIRDGSGRTLRAFGAFDALGRPGMVTEFNRQDTDDDNVVTERVYNSRGEVLSEADTVYNQVSVRKGIFDPAGNRTGLAYAPNGFTATFGYTDVNRLQTVTAGGISAKYAWNGLGQLNTLTVNTHVTEYKYFNNGWLKQVTPPAGAGVAMTRTGTGEKDVVSTGTKTVDFGYDALRRMTTATYGGTATWGNDIFALDALDNRFGNNTVDGILTNYALANLTQVAKVNTQDILYDARGNTTDDSKFQYAWDAFDRLTTVTNNNTGNMKRHTDGAKGQSGSVWTITFPNQKRVNVVELVGAPGDAGVTVEYSPTDGDPWGTVAETARSTPTDPAGLWVSFNEIHAKRMRITQTSGTSATDVNAGWLVGNWREIRYVYDGYGRRVGKSVDGARTRYVFDGYRMIEERRASDDQILKQFVYGDGINEPLGYRTFTSNGDPDKTYTYTKDDLGSPLALLEGVTIVEKYEYAAYGKTRILDTNDVVKTVDDDDDDRNNDGLIDIDLPGANQPATPRIPQIASDFGNPFMFTGMWRDSATGLYHTHYREYNPEMGRWLTPDPAGYRDGQNLYAYYPGPNGVDVLGDRGEKLWKWKEQTETTPIIGRFYSAFYGVLYGVVNIDQWVEQIGEDFASGAMEERAVGAASVVQLGLNPSANKALNTEEGRAGAKAAGEGVDAFIVVDLSRVGAQIVVKGAPAVWGCIVRNGRTTWEPVVAGEPLPSSAGVVLVPGEATVTEVAGVTASNAGILAESAESASTVSRIRTVSQKGFDYAIENPRVSGLNRMQLGKDAEVQATRWVRKWAERNAVMLGNEGLQFQVRGANSIPDVIYEPAKQIFDFKLTPKAIRSAQSLNFARDFQDYIVEYIVGRRK